MKIELVSTGNGSIRLWRFPAALDLRKRLWERRAGNRDLVLQSVPGETVERVWDLWVAPYDNLYGCVEGLTASSASGDVEVRLSYIAPDGTLIHQDKVAVTVLKVEIVPDWNHDRVIDDDDHERVTISNPFRFWINDDDDSGNEASEIVICPVI